MPLKETKSQFNGHRQNSDILKYLKAGGKLDASKAWRLFSCSKLATRVSEFVRKGHLPGLKKRRKKVETKYGVVSVMEYFVPKS